MRPPEVCLDGKLLLETPMLSEYMGYLSTSHTQDLHDLYTHTHNYFTDLYIFDMSVQQHATSTTRGE